MRKAMPYFMIATAKRRTRIRHRTLVYKNHIRPILRSHRPDIWALVLVVLVTLRGKFINFIFQAFSSAVFATHLSMFSLTDCYQGIDSKREIHRIC